MRFFQIFITLLSLFFALNLSAKTSILITKKQSALLAKLRILQPID
jgi:hypothetical protein